MKTFKRFFENSINSMVSEVAELNLWKCKEIEESLENIVRLMGKSSYSSLVADYAKRKEITILSELRDEMKSLFHTLPENGKNKRLTRLRVQLFDIYKKMDAWANYLESDEYGQRKWRERQAEKSYQQRLGLKKKKNSYTSQSVKEAA